jgi:hypothetical protein
VIVQRPNSIGAAIVATPRLELQTPIPYHAQVYASVNGGRWFVLGLAHDGKACDIPAESWTARLEPGSIGCR